MAQPATIAKPPRRLWLPRFSLAALFLLVTAAAIGTWYWYQWPFEVRNVSYLPAGQADPFAPPGAAAAAPGQVVRLEIETVRRVWSRERRTIRHGPWRVYDGRDVLLNEGHYRNGAKHGRFAAYDAAGQLRSEEFFDRGILHGPSRHWNAAGKLLVETNFDRGVKHGRFAESHANGEPAAEGEFDRGVPTGDWTWHPRFGKRPSKQKSSGVITGSWHEGKPDGLWEGRDAAGQVYFSARFDRGRLTSVARGRFEKRLVELIGNGTIREPNLLVGLFAPVTANVVETPLQDTLNYFTDLTGAQFRIAPRSAIELPARQPPEKVESYPVRLSAQTTILVPVDPNAPVSQYELELSPAPEPPPAPRMISVANLRINGNSENLPLIAALEKILEPHGLVCDFRHGSLCIDRADAARTWQDLTGVSQLVPPRATRLSQIWDQPTPIGMEFVQTPIADALMFQQDQNGPGLKFDLSQAPAARVSVSVNGLSFKNSLGVLLEQADCEASLRGNTIVIEPRRSR